MFRGAINALESVQSTHVYHLTQSFRFGPQIGLAANACLEMLQKVKKQTLVGGKKQDFLIQREDIVDVAKYKPIGNVQFYFNLSQFCTLDGVSPKNIVKIEFPTFFFSDKFGFL